MFWRNTASRRMNDDLFNLLTQDIGVNNVVLSESKPTKIAVIMTGQLARLELCTKIDNVILHNARAGRKVDLFILLDKNVDEIKQTSYKIDYSRMPYSKYDRHELVSYITRKVIDQHMEKMVKIYVRLEDPSMDTFILDRFPPVNDHGRAKNQVYTSSEKRFHNIMRTFNGIRDCSKWIQEVEYDQKYFYDLVVRMRDDTLALDTWTIDHTYMNIATFAKSGSADGLNDHNYVIDRKYIEVYRSFSEDYYFNKTLNQVFWGNPEHRILQIIASYRIPVRTLEFCNFPLINHRGMVVKDGTYSHWLLHYQYLKVFINECKYCDSCKSILESGVLAIGM